MKATTILRGTGVIGIVALYSVYAMNQPELSLTSLSMAVLGIIALISPEVISSLPFGPSK